MAWASGRFDARALPLGEQDRQRLEILARLRLDLLAAARDRFPERLDSLRRAGDAEFGQRLWLYPEERASKVLSWELRGWSSGACKSCAR
jgi:hypothetical protein